MDFKISRAVRRFVRLSKNTTPSTVGMKARRSYPNPCSLRAVGVKAKGIYPTPVVDGKYFTTYPTPVADGKCF